MTWTIWARKKAEITTNNPMRAVVRLLVADWILAESPAEVRYEKPAEISWIKKMRPAITMAYMMSLEMRRASDWLGSNGEKRIVKLSKI